MQLPEYVDRVNSLENRIGLEAAPFIHLGVFAQKRNKAQNPLFCQVTVRLDKKYGCFFDGDSLEGLSGLRRYKLKLPFTQTG